ncbi:MAG: AraC family transcriptional regulator [Candidatus Eisenbacteria bacterium]
MSPQARARLRDDRMPEFSVGRYTPGFGQEPHSHDYDGMTLVLRGRLEETVAARVESASALSVVFKPAGVIHGLSVGEEGATTLQIRLAAGTLAAALPAVVLSDRVSMHPAGWQWTHAGPAAAEMLRSISVSNAPWRGQYPSAMASRRATVAGLLRVFSEGCRGRLEDPGSRDMIVPTWLEQVRDSLTTPAHGVRLAAAARAARVHPVYLARVFRRHYGCSVGEVAKRARLRLAARLLGEPDIPLADVAGEAGFADQAHLCREFRFQTGVTPLQYRRAALDA